MPRDFEHDMAYHEDYPELNTMLPRHNKVNRAYVKKAIELIERLLELQGKKD